MSVEEKHWWAYGVIALGVPAVYFAILLREVATTPVDEIEFQLPLLIAGASGVVLAIVATIVIRIAAAIGAPRGALLNDARDRGIHRFGEFVAGIVLAAAMVVPFSLAMLRADQFWIANAMYLAFVVSAVAGSAVKVASYRRDF